MASRGLPPRWKNCPNFGEIVADTFIPMKVPLDDSYRPLLTPSQHFTPTKFLDYMEQKKIQIGLWIDLTNTDRYYDKSLVENRGIRYVKLKCAGHSECPTPEQTQVFIRICSRLTADQPNKKIAVHCTHGFNRTGFMICAYLVEHENWDIEAAVKRFSQCRPPGIYKQDYLNELFRRFGDPDGDVIPAPPRPDWCNEDFDFNDDQFCPTTQGNFSTGDQSTTTAPAKYLEGINDIILVQDPEKVRILQETCKEMCQFRLNGFPGCQPVSLTHQNLSMLQEEYMSSWKADGTRYMMYIESGDQMYFFDRDNQVYQIFNLSFFRRNSNQRLTKTLLDGEMVIDVVDGHSTPRYLIYDIVYCDGQDVSELNFRERLNLIRKQVYEPREMAKKNRLINREQEPIGVRPKDFYDLRYTYKFFEHKFQRCLPHEIDGLIFQPVNLPYLAGRCDQVLKWKPPSHNSVDFLLRIVEETRPGRVERYLGQLFVGGKREPFALIPVTNELKKYQDKIIECRFDIPRNTWVFMRERTDKSHPNGLNTANNVVYSIQYPITREYLLEFIAKHGWRPPNQPPPPQPPPHSGHG